MLRMTKQLLGVLIVVVLPLSTALAPSDYELGKQYWSEGKYREAFTHLWRYRDTPYGRSAQVDYMLGTAGCRLTDLKTWGGNFLEWILRRYALENTSRALVTRELELCRSGGASSHVVEVPQEVTMLGAVSRGSSKTYYWLGRDEAINAYGAERIRDVSKQELETRLIPLRNRERALKETEARVPGSKVTVYDRFILASESGHTPETLDRMATSLERYIRFLEREYSVELPNQYITIYLLPSTERLGALASSLHGLKVGRATWGYSFRDDMSVLAAVPGTFAPGTVMHELFHLAVRSRFGDIPPWLDEGMASLYEVSKFQGDRVLGIPNWRGRVLAALSHLRPEVKELVGSDWVAFEQPDGSSVGDLEDSPPAAMMAANLATARYFTMYLQEQGQLTAIYQTLRDLQPTAESPSDLTAATISVIEQSLGRDIAQVDKDFNSWFEGTPKPE